MLSEIIWFLSPNSQFVISGEPQNAEEYENQVTWLSSEKQPVWSEIEAARPIVEQQKVHDQAKRYRSNAYRAEADPLFFGWQRGENTEQAWLDKVAEIRARYPYPA